MRGFRRHLGKIEKAMGLGLVATGLLFVTNTIPDVANWMIEYVPAMG
jgi:cytochrome c-type biogenesis protein